MENDSVVVTGATGQVGRATIDALVRRDIRPTALVRRDESFADCTTISDWLNSDRAFTAIACAQTVVHLAGTLNPADHNYERANIIPTQRVASAVTPARTRKLIFLSMSAHLSAQPIAICRQRPGPSGCCGRLEWP